MTIRAGVLSTLVAAAAAAEAPAAPAEAPTEDGAAKPSEADCRAAKADARAAARLERKARHAEAVERLRAALDRCPGVETLVRLAAALDKLGRTAEAADLVEFQRAEGRLLGLTRSRVEEIDRLLGDLRKKVGRLTVRAGEAGTHVTIDGRAAGTTPLARAVHVGPGAHRVAARKDGFRPDEQSVEVRAGAEHTVTLTLAPEGSHVRVTVTENGATISVDGREVGRSPLRAAVEVRRGHHLVEARREGFVTASEPIRVEPGQTAYVRLFLRPAPGTAASVPAPGETVTEVSITPPGAGKTAAK